MNKETKNINNDINFEIFCDELNKENCVSDNSQILYKYVWSRDYDKVVNNNGLSLRFKNICDFEDKTEAKIINEYYKKAICNLLRNNKISKNEYDDFCDVAVSETIQKDFCYGCNNVSNWEKHECNVFVYCLSRKKNDETLFKRFGDKCIGILKLDNYYLRTFCKDLLANYRIENYSVLYGEQAISYLESKTLEELGKERELGLKRMDISDLLMDMQCYCKDWCYADEDEVRIVLYENKDNRLYNSFDKKYSINKNLSINNNDNCLYLLLKDYTDLNIKQDI